MSWNQVSEIGLGIMCLVITCPESGVQIWIEIRCLGIACPSSHILESGVHFDLGIKSHLELHVKAQM